MNPFQRHRAGFAAAVKGGLSRASRFTRTPHFAANGAGLLVAVGLSLVAAAQLDSSPAGLSATRLEREAADPQALQISVADANGLAVPRRAFRRVASASLVADAILLALADPRDIVAFSSYARQARGAQRFAGKATLSPGLEPESVISLGPDLLLANNVALIGALERLRGAGVVVFDLGPMNGLPGLLSSIDRVGALLGREVHAAQLRASVLNRLDALRDAVHGRQRPRGLYLGLHGGVVTGGTVGSSFHDVLHFGGVDDIAAASFSGWPTYTSEQLLQLAPRLVVTQEGMGDPLCRRPGLAALPACGSEGRIVELPSDLLIDPGLALVEAAEMLYARVHSGAGHSSGDSG